MRQRLPVSGKQTVRKRWAQKVPPTLQPYADPPCAPTLLPLTQVTSADLSEGMEATTIGGGKLKFTLAGGAKVNGVAIKKADVSATNGVIHVVSGVITP